MRTKIIPIVFLVLGTVLLAELPPRVKILCSHFMHGEKNKIQEYIDRSNIKTIVYLGHVYRPSKKEMDEIDAPILRLIKDPEQLEYLDEPPALFNSQKQYVIIYGNGSVTAVDFNEVQNCYMMRSESFICYLAPQKTPTSR